MPHAGQRARGGAGQGIGTCQVQAPRIGRSARPPPCAAPAVPDGRSRCQPLRPEGKCGGTLKRNNKENQLLLSPGTPGRASKSHKTLQGRGIWPYVSPFPQDHGDSRGGEVLPAAPAGHEPPPPPHVPCPPYNVLGAPRLSAAAARRGPPRCCLQMLPPALKFPPRGRRGYDAGERDFLLLKPGLRARNSWRCDSARDRGPLPCPRPGARGGDGGGDGQPGRPALARPRRRPTCPGRLRQQRPGGSAAVSGGAPARGRGRGQGRRLGGCRCSRGMRPSGAAPLPAPAQAGTQGLEGAES